MTQKPRTLFVLFLIFSLVGATETLAQRKSRRGGINRRPTPRSVGRSSVRRASPKRSSVRSNSRPSSRGRGRVARPSRRARIGPSRKAGPSRSRGRSVRPRSSGRPSSTGRIGPARRPQIGSSRKASPRRSAPAQSRISPKRSVGRGAIKPSRMSRPTTRGSVLRVSPKIGPTAPRRFLTLNVKIRINGDAGTPEDNFTSADEEVLQAIQGVVRATAGRISVKNLLGTSRPTLTIEK